MRTDLPSGTVTFLFTDVEGSTKLLEALGAEAYADALAEHRRLLREAFTRHGGVEVDTQGDAFFVAFPTAPGALAAAREASETLATEPIRVRMGIHTGTPHLSPEGYVGADVHRAARIAEAGHGGQVLVSAATAALLHGVNLRDLGEHRLKDLSAPERIFQLGDADHPPLKTLHHTNLPVPATAFLGREAEVAEVTALVSRDGVRVVTLTGPGGTGKTRLALAVAGGLAERYPDGVWWVPLAPLRDPALVLASAASAVGASADLAEHIGDKRLLILLDNFEHLMSAAADLAPLLARCRNLSLLVTSREALHLTGEHEYAVDPLREPDAVQLFLTRALAARRDVTANGEVAAICDRLDHLPLAIELAAARVKVLTPRALLERLDQRLPILAGGARDLPERQRTLRATIEWSHELLTAEEQRLFARLAVFRGGCTLEAAEAVADADLDTLQSLIDKSLVRVRGERFWMLETIREYAAERLEASGDADEVRARHWHFFLELAELAEPHLRGNPKEWADPVNREHDNIRAALDRLDAAGHDELALRLAGAMAQFWYLRNYVVEGRRRLESVLARDERPTAARAKALVGSAVMAFGDADLEPAAARAQEALDLYRRLGDTPGVAYSAMMLANAIGEGEAPDNARARMLHEESIAAFRELGDVDGELRATYNLAIVWHHLGDFDRERALLEGIIRRARPLGLVRDESMALGALSGLVRRDGDFRGAARMLADCIRIERDLGDLAWTTNNLGRLAHSLAMEGRGVAAARVLGTAEHLRERIGLKWFPWAVEMNDETREKISSELGPAAFAAAIEAGRALSVDDVIALALEA